MNALFPQRMPANDERVAPVPFGISVAASRKRVKSESLIRRVFWYAPDEAPEPVFSASSLKESDF